ncbi:hypothetical protein RDWZM_005119 [Blomia tropicalis]|uniref:Uncharacterized protein n=1 Tax=Blomia tropicalis TaxID=40697 RepID=A0A9Q0M5J1_BLOTA|nr:hypothetical protein RDWZM_005119 [Blomia tropicalis]
MAHSIIDNVNRILIWIVLFSTFLVDIGYGRITGKRWHGHPYDRSQRTTTITDFRYNTAHIDGITRLFNNSLLVISNGHYWTLDRGELPRIDNVRGPISQLYDGFKNIDSIWTDPYNDLSEQVYLVSNTAKHGLRVVCQEFGEQFTSESTFCHLPVDNRWLAALKDLSLDKPIDAVTWRNRTKDKDGGFWVFFQGTKMITIDPYEMDLRFTYDLRKWMSINETITGAFYDYHNHIYHLFFANNRYRTWTVNVTRQNSLPMSWDRAFLHGALSQPMLINRDFFHFSQREIRNWPQPFYEQWNESFDGIDNNRIDSNIRTSLSSSSSSSRPVTTTEHYSDIVYVSPRGEILNNRLPNGKLVESNSEFEKSNSVEHSETVSFQKQLMELNQEGVLDFAPSKTSMELNHSKDLKSNFSILIIYFLSSYLVPRFLVNI